MMVEIQMESNRRQAERLFALNVQIAVTYLIARSILRSLPCFPAARQSQYWHLLNQVDGSAAEALLSITRLGVGSLVQALYGPE